MTTWEGDGTTLTRGFATLRMQTNGLHCSAEERARSKRYTTDPVQLLCRALRMTPACYRRFEVVAAHPDLQMQVEADAAFVVLHAFY